MSYTTVSNTVEFAKLKYADARNETPATSDYKNYYVANLRMFDSSTTTMTRNGTTVIASDYTVEEKLGRVTFTVANSSSDAIRATYTYCDCSSAEIQRNITRADTVIGNTISDTTATDTVETLSLMLTSHLIYKGLAAKSGRGGMASYSIGFFSVGKGTSPAKEIADMFYQDYLDLTAKLDTGTGMKMTWRQTGNDEWNKYYNKSKLVPENDETIRLTNSPGMSYET